MVLDYYHLREQPFGVEPDPRFLFMSRTHEEAWASLLYGLREQRGFLALVAPPGMGKTTLLFRLLLDLRDRARTVFLFQTQCNPEQFLHYLLRDLGLVPGADLVSNHEQLNQLLLNEARAGRHFVLIVDEAQGLEPSVLETIRLLSDFETPGRKLLQIILAGQLPLVETLMRPDMEQLRQRISLMASLKPLNRGNVREYVAHRLQVAGHSGGALFTEKALRMIADSSQGIPRNINHICFNALSIGYARTKKRIDREVMEEALADREMESLLPKRFFGASGSRSKPSLSLTPRFTVRSYLFGKRGRIALITAALVLAAVGYRWVPKTTSPWPLSIGKLPSAARQKETILAEQPSPSPPREAKVAAPIKSQSNVVVVAPGQTLSEISLHYLGAYGPITLARLQALNPTLTDPDVIEPGRQIHLPADAPRWQAPPSSENSVLRNLP